ncbi:MAG: IS110 family transposase [Chitinophagaceae bacterium]|nr:IS110 family transposase [Chitinophagaceae bacterium]
MSKVKQLNFSGKVINCGLDVHKTNWKVNARMDGIEIATFSQDPDTVLLKKHFEKHYPGAELRVVYEAGFCGFEIQRSLTALGIECIVVNAADIPTSDKDRKRKDDKRDARKLSQELSKGELKGIYIPGREMQAARTLVRQRYRLVQDQTRWKNRIKHLLMNNGIRIAAEERWSTRYINKIKEMNVDFPALKRAVDIAIGQYLQIRHILKETTMAIRAMSKQAPFLEVQGYLQSIDGVGLITGMVIQTEIEDINRFKRFDSLCDYVGFVPDIYSSNDKTKVRGISKRGNSFLKEVLIESSWILIRKDPAILMKYNEYRSRMNANKAIVRIGKHLLSRIRFLWRNEQRYVRGLINSEPLCVL